MMIETTSWHSYGKIYNLGHKETEALFSGIVSIEEKVDGSQFNFGVFDVILKVRSKGREFDPLAPDGIFKGATGTARDLADAGALVDGWTYRGEALQEVRHNTLRYGRVPFGNLVIFDIARAEEDYLPYDQKAEVCKELGLECVPLLWIGESPDEDTLAGLMERDSFLGMAKIEGIVIKNYSQFDERGKALMGKIVAAEFREQHKKAWKVSNATQADILAALSERYTTEARWKKAMQRLRDDGKLESHPKDIPGLMSELVRDFRDECRSEVAEELLKWAMPHIERKITRGLPEWYKATLEPAVPTQDSVTA